MPFSKRLLRALGGIALALLNATLLLVIAAALSVGYLVHQVDRAAETGAARVTAAAMNAAGMEPGALRRSIDALTTQVEALRGQFDAGDTAGATAALTRIDDRLETIANTLQRIAEPTITVSPETIENVKTAVGQVANQVLRLRGDAAPASSQASP